MGEFVVIDGDVFPIGDSESSSRAEAQDTMADLGIESTAIHSEDHCGSCPNSRLLARVFVVIPYTKQYSDDHGAPMYTIVRARSAEHATELVADSAGCGLIDDEAFWSREANEKGDTVEGAGDGCFYHMWSCDCGDEGCHDENSDHESQTETILFRFDESTVYATREAAIKSRQEQTPAVEYLDT